MIDRSLTMAVRPPCLVRLGRPGDGGYSVPLDVLRTCDGVVGLGVRDDWSFEEAAARAMSHCHGVHLYDPTTTFGWLFRRCLGVVPKFIAHAATLDRPRITEDAHRFLAPIRYLRMPLHSTVHFREWAGGHQGTPLSTIIERLRAQGANRLVLKFDIEGGEYELLGDPGTWATHVALVVAEFHDLEPDPSRFHDLLGTINQHFTPVHIHANSGAGVLPCGFPRVPEFTFVRTDLLPTGSRRAIQRYPIAGLDQGNQRGHKALAFEA